MTTPSPVSNAPARSIVPTNRATHPALCFLVACLLVAIDAPGQAPTTTEKERTAQQSSGGGQDQARNQALHDLVTRIAARNADLEQARKELNAATEQAAREKAQAEVKRLGADLEKLRHDFQSFAAGVSLAEYDEPPQSKLDLLQEIVSLVRPILSELREATKTPRQMDQLENDQAEFRRRRLLAEKSLRALDGIQGMDGDLKTRLDALRIQWERRRADALGREQIAGHQLETLRSNQEPIFDSVRNAFENFFRTKGLHILLAVGAFLLVFFGFRLMSRPVRSALGGKRKDGRAGFQARLVHVLFHSFVTVFATIAALFVLYAAGDWGLLGLSLFFLLGLAWASKNTLPKFFDQTRLLLNIGPVREGERITLHHLPWRVRRIGIHSILENPELDGGVLRLPIKDLIDMRSRILGENESWFPTREGDWVLMPDGTRGKVVSQTPEMVQLVQLGGARVTYPTKLFLEAQPKNLSSDFRVRVTFGVDYQHQPLATTEIPRVMQTNVEAELLAIVGEDGLHKLNVEFQSAGASSLDYAVLADFRGSQAAKYDALGRAIQRVLVDSCNANGWVIPFTQITVHQAAG